MKIFENQKKAIESILEERERQKSLWGRQVHDLPTWMTILTEEVGEVAQEVLNVKFKKHSIDCLRKELVQVAAVAVQILEQIDERELK